MSSRCLLFLHPPTEAVPFPLSPGAHSLLQVLLSPNFPPSQFTSLCPQDCSGNTTIVISILSLTSGFHLKHFSGILLFLGQNHRFLRWHLRPHTVCLLLPPFLPSNHTILGVLRGCQQLSTHRAFAHAVPLSECSPSSPSSCETPILPSDPSSAF